jgi:hypothetical protein
MLEDDTYAAVRQLFEHYYPFDKANWATTARAQEFLDRIESCGLSLDSLLAGEYRDAVKRLHAEFSKKE